MPEGPEVKRIGHDLSQKISGKSIRSIEIVSGRYTKKPIVGWDQMINALPTKIVGVGVHGKFLYILTSSGYNMWCTLGMTGQWSDQRTKHTRIKIQTSTNNSVYYNDQRNFGTIKFVYGPNKLKKKLQALGPDMLTEDLGPDEFVSCLRRKESWNITKALMDQTVIAGVGNYIKAEALWLAGLNPLCLLYTSPSPRD